MNTKRISAAMLTLCLLAGCAAPPEAVSDTPVGSTTTAAATSITAATTTTATAAPTSKQEELYDLLTKGHIAEIYRESYASVFNRIEESGFLQESLTGRYRGEYVRSVGALAILADLVGEQETAKNCLRFVTDVMQKKSLTAVPFVISADGNTVNTADELDGRAHFVYGWALYIAKSGDTTYFEETYPLMKREADAFCSDTYFYADWGLMRNRRFTHTRVRNGNDYHDAFDLLTNSFAAAALEQMVAVAAANGHAADTEKWSDTLQMLKMGIAENLTRTVDGKCLYLELRDFDGGAGTAETGVSWVCLSPFAAGMAGVDAATLRNTAAYTQKVLWKTSGDGGYLAVESSASGTVRNYILGKSIGWDIAAALQSGDETHILQTLRFLEKNHTAVVYMEQMRPSGNGWTTVDCGNAEQVIWFLWGMAQLRQAVGLPMKP